MSSSETPDASYDDFSSTITYSEGWAGFSNTTGEFALLLLSLRRSPPSADPDPPLGRISTGDASASQYSNGTFHQCASAAISTGPTCYATIPFEGTGAAVYGDSSSAHGRFFCAIDGEGKEWYDGGSLADWGVGRLMCR